MLAEYIAQWIALGFLFLLASTFSERTSKYGYVLIPLVAGLFAFIGWLPPEYLGVVVPLLLSLGVITFLKEQFRTKLGGYGSSGSFIWKIFFFLIILQVAIVFVNGMGIFNAQMQINNKDIDKTAASYSLTNLTDGNVDPVTGAFGKSAVTTFLDTAWFFGGLMMTAFVMMWTIFIGTFTIYSTLTWVFGFPPIVAAALSSVVFLMIPVEIFILFAKPAKQPDQ
jgi:hypothetical protein